jgi:hypothetical protein
LTHLDGIERQLGTLDARLAEVAAGERWAGQVQILTRFRGIQTLTALGLIAEIGDFSRFSYPRELASWLGITPSEYSSGDQQYGGHITLSGNQHARRLLIEAAWHYRHAPRRPKTGPPPHERAWQAQVRLHLPPPPPYRTRQTLDRRQRRRRPRALRVLRAAMTNQPLRATDTTTTTINQPRRPPPSTDPLPVVGPGGAVRPARRILVWIYAKPTRDASPIVHESPGPTNTRHHDHQHQHQ